MTWLLIVGFAVSSSLDNLGVGISYGIRKIRVGVLSNLLIAIICFLFSETGILFGQWLSNILPGMFPVLVSAFILMVIGLGESVVLGIALSANAVTNGLSAGLLGLSPLAISLTAAQGSFISVWFGVIIGRKVAGVRIGAFTLGQFGTLISGVILLVIAGNSLFG
ncbi:putative sporulation protein YtaF [Paenibacillus tianmuensis]|uniref:Putative sporulation protein YtaF n=1 Tax=Paenibacillus tianmuensis TaxID=624147 RepID=A0A1G4RD79_9BACL|nr:manganese efflux pump [Paenibacillus tianmuensis]SCW54863.1 putative sporulation protein YtaF [Paenibacillus tianmuensis]